MFHLGGDFSHCVLENINKVWAFLVLFMTAQFAQKTSDGVYSHAQNHEVSVPSLDRSAVRPCHNLLGQAIGVSAWYTDSRISFLLILVVLLFLSGTEWHLQSCFWEMHPPD